MLDYRLLVAGKAISNGSSVDSGRRVWRRPCPLSLSTRRFTRLSVGSGGWQAKASLLRSGGLRCSATLNFTSSTSELHPLPTLLSRESLGYHVHHIFQNAVQSATSMSRPVRPLSSVLVTLPCPRRVCQVHRLCTPTSQNGEGHSQSTRAANACPVANSARCYLPILPIYQADAWMAGCEGSSLATLSSRSLGAHGDKVCM